MHKEEPFLSINELVIAVNNKVSGKKNPDIPYVGLEHMAPNEPFLITTAPSDSSISINSIFKKGDILFGKLRPNLRKSLPALFDGYCSTDILVLRARPGISPEFAAKVFQSEAVFRAVVRTSEGTKMPRTSWNKLKILPVFVPKPLEQHVLSRILDTLDIQIQQTEQLIAKLKQIKLGLLHDLLTQGINENGDVRDPVAHPEEFKDSVLGKVPQKWKVSTLGDVVHSNGGLIQTGPFGSQLHAHEYVHEGVPVIMPQAIENERINTFQIARITPKKAAKLSRHSVEFNDVIFGRRGDLDRCAFIDLPEVDFICGTDCLLVRPPKKLIDGRWLAAIYRHHHSQEQIRAKAVGSIMLGLNSTLLAKLVIAVPPLIEQKAIMDKIATFTDDISIEEFGLAKLKQIKKGLMHDLLTGRVRVTQLITEREHLSI
jgi:type I restriction enzyme S subunit